LVNEKRNDLINKIMEDRDADTAEFLWETVPEPIRESIKAACLDMSGIYKDWGLPGASGSRGA